MICYSWNLNGIRSASKKGFLDVLMASNADIFLLQETRAFAKDLSQELLDPGPYRSYFYPAEKAGYSGVAVYSKLPRDEVEVKCGLGFEEFDREGRWLEFRHRGFQTTFVSAYYPNSQRDGVRLDFKMKFCDASLNRLKTLRAAGDNVVLGGDLNIAHEERDLANPKQNHRNAGFLPEERAWFSKLMSDGYRDSFRIFEQGAGHYTWWSARAGVRERNIGWRLDYHITDADFEERIISSRIHANLMGSDHCPVSLEMEFSGRKRQK